MTGQPETALPPAEDATDRELLERFVARGEDAAFATLVERHGAAVLGVCRRALVCEQDAEDAFQATFLTLARRAASVPWQESVRHWLRAVARRLALRARGHADRLRWRASPLDLDAPEPADPRPGPPAAAERRELSLVLDEELDRLPEVYRAAVVLCYLHGKTNEQAASELGWPSGSMSRRLARARELLRERLTRRGVTVALVLACLALACSWLVSFPPTPRPAVVATMAPFAPGEECDEGFERLLTRAAEGPVADGDRERLARLARQAVRTSDAVKGHDPGRRREEWRRHSEQMRGSATDLSEALAHHDERMVRRAAGQLATTCQGCHATFRE